MRNHLLIAGAGRSGASLLVCMLEACGFETELSRRPGAVFRDPDAKADSARIPTIGEDHPYVVRSPWSHLFVRELLARPDIGLDRVLIPVRDLAEATAASIVLELGHRYERVAAAALTEDTWLDWSAVPGGATYSLEPLDQARMLAHALYRTVEALAEHGVPIAFLSFPRFSRDLEYAYRCLLPILESRLSLAEFSERVSPLIDGGPNRPGRAVPAGRPELAVQVKQQPKSQTATGLPAFEELDRIALKRELSRLQRQATAERDSLVGERDALAAARDTLAAERAGLIAERDALVIERVELHAKLARLTGEHVHIRSQVDSMVNSTSWKVTQPVRAGVEFVRKRRKFAVGR
jgi:hypothetical protein